MAYDNTGSANYSQESHTNQTFDNSAASAESIFGGQSQGSYGQESTGMSGYGSASDMFDSSQTSSEHGFGSYDHNGYNGAEAYNGQQSEAQATSVASMTGEQQSASFEQHGAAHFGQQDESAEFHGMQAPTADNFFGGATQHQFDQSNAQPGFDSRVDEQQQHHQSNSSQGYFGQPSYQNNAHGQQHQESHFHDGAAQSYGSYDQNNAQESAFSQTSVNESVHSSGSFFDAPLSAAFDQRSLAPPSLSRGVSNASSYAEQHFNGTSEGDHHQSYSQAFPTAGRAGSTLVTQRKSLGNASASSMDARDETPLRKRSSSFNSSHMGADNGEMASSDHDYYHSNAVPPSPANSFFGQAPPVQGDNSTFGQPPAHGSAFGNPPNAHAGYGSHSITESHQHAHFPAHPPSVGGKSDDTRSHDGDRAIHQDAAHHFQPSQTSVGGGSEYGGFQNDFGRSSMDSHDLNALPVQEVDASSYFGGSASSSGFDGFNQAQTAVAPSDFFAASGPPEHNAQNHSYAMQQQQQQQQYPVANLAPASHPQSYTTQAQQQHQHAPAYQQSHGSHSSHDAYGAGAGMQRSLSSASMSSHHSESYYAHQAPAASFAHQYQQHHAQAPVAHAGYQQNATFHQPPHAPAYNQAPSQGYNTGYGSAQASYNDTPAARQSKYKDPCVAPPSCLASFGFGGTVVTMFPKRKLRLNNAGSSFRNSPRMPMYVITFLLALIEIRCSQSLCVGSQAFSV